jgi:hypothetical protein
MFKIDRAYRPTDIIKKRLHRVALSLVTTVYKTGAGHPRGLVQPRKTVEGKGALNASSSVYFLLSATQFKLSFSHNTTSEGAHMQVAPKYFGR